MRRRLLFRAAVLVIAILATELGARIALHFDTGLPVRTPGRVLEALYPRLGTLRQRNVPPNDELLDVLLLGGSVLDESFSPVPCALAEAIELKTERRVRLHIAAACSQNSLDSAALFEALDVEAYDAVVVHHGINDLALNRVPVEAFRHDCGHERRQRDLQTLVRSQFGESIVLPYAIARILDGVGDALGTSGVVVNRASPPEFDSHGADIKSAMPFRRNLAQIAALASTRGEPLVLMTFATHISPDYAPVAFAERRLDYGRHCGAVEGWGQPSHGRQGMAIHNQVLRDVAQEFGVRLVDMDRLMPRGAKYFDDPCHLSLTGALTFASLAVDEIAAAVGSEPSGPR